MVQTFLFAFFPSMEHFVFYPVKKTMLQMVFSQLKENMTED